MSSRLATGFAALAIVVLTISHVSTRQTPKVPSPLNASAPPKLAVILVVDQMRADYIDRFQTDWTSGLKRLVTDGAWFRNAAYPYLNSVTCAGHATVATGAFPHTHGVIHNGWWDRAARKTMTCIEDPGATDIGYGVSVNAGDSAYRLAVPSFTDRMRAERAAHVVALSLKADSAIMLAGHGGDAVTWLTGTLNGWATSSVYSTKPQPVVKTFTDANPLTFDYGKTWNRLLPLTRYQETDAGVAEAPPVGWTRLFPHVLRGASTQPDASFFAQWQRSPFADAYLGRFAEALVDSMQLGRHEGTDVLAIGFSAPDLIGHAFGPRSQETEDAYAYLDRTIGALLDRLDALVGRDQYVVALTADHGVTPIPEQLIVDGKDAGRLSAEVISEAIERRLRVTWGEGKYVSAVNGNEVYFEPDVYEKLRKSPAVLAAVMARIAALPGVRRVFRSEQVHLAEKSLDRLLRAAALSYFPGRSGDLIIVPKPGWMFSATGTTHGTANLDDERVPILFFGRGIKTGQYSDMVTPADISPTLAAICRITMPTAEGHALRVALKAHSGTGRSATN